MADHRGFVTALERAYVTEVRRRTASGLRPLDGHRAALAAAIHAADPSHGGLRFRALDGSMRAELEERLLRVWG